MVAGSGTAGAAITCRFAAYGASVVCFEQGDSLRQRSFASERARIREPRFAGAAARCSPNDRKPPEENPVTTAGDGPTNIVMWNVITLSVRSTGKGTSRGSIGPTSLCGASTTWRRTGRFRYDDLEPLLRPKRLDGRRLGPSRRPGECRSRDRAAPPHSRSDSRAKRWCAGFEKLGWHWWPYGQTRSFCATPTAAAAGTIAGRRDLELTS